MSDSLPPNGGPDPYDGRDLEGLLSGENVRLPDGMRPVAGTLAALRAAPDAAPSWPARRRRGRPSAQIMQLPTTALACARALPPPSSRSASPLASARQGTSLVSQSLVLAPSCLGAKRRARFGSRGGSVASASVRGRGSRSDAPAPRAPAAAGGRGGRWRGAAAGGAPRSCSSAASRSRARSPAAAGQPGRPGHSSGASSAATRTGRPGRTESWGPRARSRPRQPVAQPPRRPAVGQRPGAESGRSALPPVPGRLMRTASRARTGRPNGDDLGS